MAAYEKDDDINKPIIVAYGDTNFGNLRGNLAAPAKQRNRRVPTLVVPVDEHLTSQICTKCQKRSTENEKNTSNTKLHSLLICKEECHTRWNHDHLASLNIRFAFL